MGNMISKAIIAGVAALSLSAATVATVEPAAAQQWHGGGGGWHGGGGGWHGGGGGWHGGGWGGGGWHGGGYGWRGYGYRGGGWRGYGWGGGWGPAIAAGVLTAGALAATYPYYGTGYGYDDSCWQVRPVYNAYGRFIGNQNVNVCQ